MVDSCAFKNVCFANLLGKPVLDYDFHKAATSAWGHVLDVPRIAVRAVCGAQHAPPPIPAQKPLTEIILPIMGIYALFALLLLLVFRVLVVIEVRSQRRRHASLRASGRTATEIALTERMRRIHIGFETFRGHLLAEDRQALFEMMRRSELEPQMKNMRTVRLMEKQESPWAFFCEQLCGEGFITVRNELPMEERVEALQLPAEPVDAVGAEASKVWRESSPRPNFWLSVFTFGIAGSGSGDEWEVVEELEEDEE